jgi:DNA-binding IclR family transcriptional regulator
MAYLPENQLNDLLGQMEFPKYNERTITTPSAFRAALKKVRQNGYALDLAEELEGVHCIGTPIFDRYDYPIASIWTTGPSERLPESSFEDLGKQIKKHADKISQRLR